LVAGQDGAADGYEPVLIRPERPESSAAPVASLFRRRSVQASRRGVLHLQTAGDGPVPPDLASWYTERGFHFYVATLAWPGRPRSADSDSTARDGAGKDSAARDSAASDTAADGTTAAASAAGARPAAVGPGAAQDEPAQADGAQLGPAQAGAVVAGEAASGVDAEPVTAVRAMALTALRMAEHLESGTRSAERASRPGRGAGAAEARLSKAGAAAGARAASVLAAGAGRTVSGRSPARAADTPASEPTPASVLSPEPEHEPDDSAARAAAGKVRAGRRGRKALAAAFAELDARCAQLRAADGIDNIIVMAHGAGALAAALWCAAQPPGRPADALILYGPDFGGALREGLDIDCPVLVIGSPGEPQRKRGPGLRRRPATAATVPLGRHVTWLHPADSEARPDAADAADRSRFFDEMGRWLGAYMYGQVRDQLL